MVEGEQLMAAGLADQNQGRIGDQYFACLYDELHRMAVRELHRNSAAALSPTTLLHETFLNVSQRPSAEFIDRARFMAYAARAMRGLIIDHLRHANRQKRGRNFSVIPLSDELQLDDKTDIAADRLRDALEELAAIDERLAQCVDLKFFCGFSFCDIAQLWEVSERTVLRDWDKARLLLNRLLSGTAPDSGQPA